jgi:hypothetical protein
MAQTKVIATTWAKKDLLKKLNDTLKRMDAEIVAYEKDQATYEKRKKAWEKKAMAWAIKNLAKADDSGVSSGYRNAHVSIYFETDVFEPLKDEPQPIAKPDHKETNYQKQVSDYDQVANAIALVEGAMDTEFKINSSTTWAQFIR